MYLSPARSAELRRILSLAWPVMLTSLNWTLLQVTDIIVVGLVDTGEVAALGASRSLTFVGVVLALGALTGVLVFSARADGAGELRRTGAILHQGLALAAVLGLAGGAILFVFALPMLLAIGVAADLAPASARVVQVMAFAFFPQLVMIAASFFLEGVSRPRRVMAVNLAMLPLNALLAWAMSGGHWGLPQMGAVGAAGATAIVTALGAAAMVAAALTLPGAAERGVRDWSGFRSRDTLAGACALIGFGAMPALASGLEIAGFSILIALSTQLGEAVTHAFQIVFSIHNITFGLALGFGSAAGVRVGNAVGEGRIEAAAGRTAIAAAASAAATGLCAIFLLIAAAPVVSLFPSTPQVQLVATAMLLLWAPFILFDGLQVVLVYALRSLGDQVVAGLLGIVSYFLVTGGLGIALVHAGWGARALVLASAAGMVTAALLYGARLAWISRRVPLRS
ncbi:MATE family efflux transporter [Sphingosinithalassobacter sp. CS137]|uniref:MATE family efflux transporter n=1 Tax=Sphingosinithalassobacter sp. CS137 TaxID=2762748 RepID=UPI0021CF5A05|nr:MATE family efflux transporter [Sphingosinithalassobacter sp. CS137]